MILLLAFAFLAGLVTILSPCILPLLPIILSSATGGVSRSYGIIVGFVGGFTFFTLFLSSLVQLTGISATSVRSVSVVIIFLFGASYLFPQFQALLERLFSALSSRITPRSPRPGFVSGIVVGLSLGLLWTPCVGPILASVISLAITGQVTWATFAITLAYSLGTAIPMFLIIRGGQQALSRVPGLVAHTPRIQKAFGVVMILTALALATQLDRRFQTFILNTFPNYGAGLTQLEDISAVKTRLNQLFPDLSPSATQPSGQPMFELLPESGPAAPELIPGGSWFNSHPLTLADLRGRVVIVDFWTYSCINCQRTLPYLRDWYTKYRDQGLVIIGVHSPEFEFEKDAQNVAAAIADFRLEYPVMQDNDFATWRAYSNRYWPAKYFIDKHGRVRYTHFGEGAYAESEQVIRQLLSETGAVDLPASDSDSPPASAPNYAATPETYLGYQRLEYLASPEPVAPDRSSSYSLPASVPTNSFALSGSWTIAGEFAQPDPSSHLVLNFSVQEVYLVMSPTSGDTPVKVYLDDVYQSTITVTSDRLYNLISLPLPGRHLLKLEFAAPAPRLFAFTFG